MSARDDILKMRQNIAMAGLVSEDPDSKQRAVCMCIALDAAIRVLDGATPTDAIEATMARVDMLLAQHDEQGESN